MHRNQERLNIHFWIIQGHALLLVTKKLDETVLLFEKSQDLPNDQLIHIMHKKNIHHLLKRNLFRIYTKDATYYLTENANFVVVCSYIINLKKKSKYLFFNIMLVLNSFTFSFYKDFVPPSLNIHHTSMSYRFLSHYECGNSFPSVLSTERADLTASNKFSVL